tara:strand:- start:7076 stop:7828 length:753 start_codon:yes stop_codon:yes gene_type:complete
MAGLRTLLQIGGDSGTTLDITETHIFNSNKTTQNNGGTCCLFTVPTGATWFAVELWGGGGAGAGACCCRSGWPGGSGSYARKIITGLSGGETYTMCAAGSTYCSQSYCKGCSGNPSFVNINGGAVQVCASGGGQGCSQCYFQNQCQCRACTQQQCGSFTGTMGLCGVTGAAKGSSFCGANSWGYMPSAPYTTGGNRGTMSFCTNTSGNGNGGNAHWPGGGGASAVTSSSGFQCGAAGAGGLVTIFYTTPA